MTMMSGFVQRVVNNPQRRCRSAKQVGLQMSSESCGSQSGWQTVPNDWACDRETPQYLGHMSSQYSERRPTNAWDRFTSLGHSSKFQRVSRLGFVTAAMSLNGRMHNVWPSPGLVHYIYVFGGGSCPLTEFCQVQNSLWVQVLRWKEPQDENIMGLNENMPIVLADRRHITVAVEQSRTERVN